jgi:hypothetical protein
VLAFTYGFGQNYKLNTRKYSADFTRNKSWSMSYHLLGITSSFIFKKVRWKAKPLLQMSGMTEVYNNYKLGVLSENYFPTKEPLPLVGKSYNYNTHEITNIYQANFYHSTPFIGNIMIGFNFQIIDQLHFALTAGYGLRVMKTKHLNWLEGDNYLENLNAKFVETHFFHAFDFQLSLSYAFDIHKKKPKTKEL